MKWGVSHVIVMSFLLARGLQTVSIMPVFLKVCFLLIQFDVTSIKDFSGYIFIQYHLAYHHLPVTLFTSCCQINPGQQLVHLVHQLVTVVTGFFVGCDTLHVM